MDYTSNITSWPRVANFNMLQQDTLFHLWNETIEYDISNKDVFCCIIRNSCHKEETFAITCYSKCTELFAILVI